MISVFFSFLQLVCIWCEDDWAFLSLKPDYLPDYLMVWQIGWKIWGKIGQWERTIGRSDAILKNRMESEGLWHVRLDRMDRIRLFISIIVRNALWDKYNKNRIRSVGQWERKIGWDLSKHESHPITFVNTNAIKLFKIGQWNAGFRVESSSFHSLNEEGKMKCSKRYCVVVS